MKAETKNCASCKADFEITAEDFDLYKKINVPAPTWCPDCRLQRRMAWRNDRNLYRKDCDLCGKSTVSMYSPSKKFTVYCPNCWWSDGWDTTKYGKEYDSSRSFFDQLKELQKSVPRISLLAKNCVNSEYINHSSDSKNCFMCSSIMYCEDVMYSDFILNNSRDCVDCMHAYRQIERCYECVDVDGCYQCQFTFLSRDCSNCYYCYDCRGCTDCFLSTGLRNKSNYFLNKQYSKEEYKKKVEEFNLGSHKNRVELLKKFRELVEKESIHKFATIEQSNDVIGNYIFNSKNVKKCFDIGYCEDSKYLDNVMDAKNSMDSYRNAEKIELVYECTALIRDYAIMFCNLSYDNSHIQYCDHCFNSQNLFGCIGVKKGEYMILNKKYSKEEYEKLKDKIVSDMRERGEYGEFLPMQLSPFAYNESHCYLYGEQLPKEEVLNRGLQWEDNLPGTFGKETMQPEDIPDNIKNVDDSIIKEVLKCESCSRNYNVVAPELQFYRKENIPIPRLCFPCRDRRRIESRNPRELWHRQCMCELKHETHEGRCPNEFETAYEESRKEKVYCETCYNAEIV